MAEPVKLYNGGVYLVDGKTIISEESVSGAMQDAPQLPNPDAAREGTIAYGILAEHNTSGDMGLSLIHIYHNRENARCSALQRARGASFRGK